MELHHNTKIEKICRFGKLRTILELLQSGISLPPVMAKVLVMLQVAQQNGKQPE
jgi:hypothetical protein